MSYFTEDGVATIGYGGYTVLGAGGQGLFSRHMGVGLVNGLATIIRNM